MPPYKTKWKGSQQENLTLDDVSQIVLASKPLDAYPATKAKGKMAMTSLIKVKISSIDPNPMRALGDYPFNADKIETLRRSIKDVGLWEGLIGRQRGNRIELAFGHHRHEAARKELGASAEISVIVRDLSDKQMLQFMGRENLEEYNADFLCMLESWQAAVKFGGGRRQDQQPIEIAKLLGWLGKDGKANTTAKACADAHDLVSQKHLTRKDLRGLSVHAVREIAARVHKRIADVEEIGRQRGHSKQSIDRGKERIASAGRDVANRARKGEVAQRDLRLEVDATAFETARGATKTLMFESFGRSLADRIRRFLKEGDVADRLQSVVESLPQITEDEDRAIVRRLDFELAEMGEQTVPNWRKRLARKGAVVPFLRLTKEG